MTTIKTDLPDWLARSAQQFPSHLAVQFGQTRWSFAELNHQATRLARQLASAGVREGERIALLAGSGLPYVTCVHALTRLGAILVPLNTRLSQQELCWQLVDVGASLLIHDEQYASITTQIAQTLPELARATLAERIGEKRAEQRPKTSISEAPKQHLKTLNLEVPDLSWHPADLSAPPAPLINQRGATINRAPLGEESRGVSSTEGTAINRVPLELEYSSMRPKDALVLSHLPEADIALRDFIELEATQIIMYTSGTTGQPKGVIITYGMQWWSAIGSALNLGHSPDDCWLACMPLFHIGGLAILMRSVIYGISVILQEKFDAGAVNRAIREERVSIISVVAVMLQRMLTNDHGMAQYPSTLRCVLLGGGPAP